jgi:hypothetical protein
MRFTKQQAVVNLLTQNPELRGVSPQQIVEELASAGTDVSGETVRRARTAMIEAGVPFPETTEGLDGRKRSRDRKVSEQKNKRSALNVDNLLANQYLNNRIFYAILTGKRFVADDIREYIQQHFPNVSAHFNRY